MNEQRFDKIFRDKLSSYSLEPRAEASEKLEKLFNNRKHKAWWQLSRFAAAVLILALSIFAFYNWHSEPMEEQSGPIAGTVTEIPGNTEIEADRTGSELKSAEKLSAEHQPETSGEPAESAIAAGKTPSKSETAKSTVTHSISPSHQTIPVKSEIPIRKEVAEVQQEAGQPVESDNPMVSGKTENTKPVRHKVTITYKKSPEPPEPMLALEPEPKQKNGRLKRIWKNLGPDDISLAGIRATKDQLLVINKKEKEIKSN